MFFINIAVDYSVFVLYFYLFPPCFSVLIEEERLAGARSVFLNKGEIEKWGEGAFFFFQSVG